MVELIDDLSFFSHSHSFSVGKKRKMPIKPEDFPSRFPEDVFIQQKLDPDAVVRCPYNTGESEGDVRKSARLGI